MRTVYGPNPISSPSPDVEMNVDAPETEEVAFTLVTNKKGGKGKAKVPSPPPTNFRNKILLVSRAPPAPKAVTASTAPKPAATLFFFFFFLIINLLHGAQLQSVADYLQQVAYSFRGLRGQKPPS